MLRRFTLILALAAALVPAASRAHEWEEDYTDDWSAQGDPDDSAADVDVDVDASVTFDSFHGALAPYGQWVVAGSYGRVWQPRVAAGWRPYYYGRWEWTNEGWLWVSDEPFGWAAYHYGRWALDPYYGWVWVPGYQWAPAWVSWRYSGDVIGWAPLGPGVSVFVSVNTYYDHWWTFVPCHSFVAHPIHQVAYQPTFTRRYWQATAPAPAYRGRPSGHVGGPAWGGPPPRTIEQRIGRPVTAVRVVSAPSPGAARAGNGEIAMYRPGLRGWNDSRAPAPRSSFRDDGRSAPAPRSRPEDARPAPNFRADDGRRGPAVRGDDRPQFPSRGENHDFVGENRGNRQDRGFVGEARANREQGRAWGQPDRGASNPAPSVTPAPRREAPQFAPRGGGWNGPASSQGAAPRAERSWGQGAGPAGGGELRRGGGAGAPRAMPNGGDGDRGGGNGRGHR